MLPRPNSASPAPATREMKRLLLTMVVSVAVLDTLAIAVYRVYHVPGRPVKTQEVFVAVWVVLTLIVVTTMMKRIRVARRGR